MTAGHRILLVDDDGDFVDTTAAHLEANGYRVFKAYDASEGLRIAKIERPDLIIMDVIMTERTEGLFAVQAIRRIPELRQVPIFVVTSLYARAPEFRVPANGAWLPCDEFLNKPVQFDELLTHIRRRLTGGAVALEPQAKDTTS